MNKPVPIQRDPILNYNDIITFIEKKYQIDVRDYGRKYENGGKYCDGDYPTTAWCKKHGYDYSVLDGQLSPDSEEMKLRIWINTNFRTATDRFEFERPYLDYWHWLLDNHFGEVNNPCEQYFNPSEILEDVECCEPHPLWVREITQLIYNEFKEYCDEEGGFNVYISW